ncbi:hypothetical protein JMA_41340 (plasmid) [Jeotgalibacillus malaysiensis]|uniref:Uncharacterized protein n=1 Tax=Jeotgalibacillus malaysiensis TaxID=1508404 RepID=A0A0B5ATN4_9BACL|nr:hypothetical protein [Jeotgalibacillus malaysiensis]AJD93451.1 hypothetical protein JMA_41340 [Jeotgalibacillus malaysiensis]
MLTGLIIGLGMVVPGFLGIRNWKKMSDLKKRMPLHLQHLMRKGGRLNGLALGSIAFAGILLFSIAEEMPIVIAISTIMLFFTVINLMIDALCRWSPLGIYNIFSERELGALEDIRREILRAENKGQKHRIFTNEKASEIGDNVWVIDGKGFDEFRLHTLSESEFEQALVLKEQLYDFFAAQEMRYETRFTLKQFHDQFELANEINEGFKRLRQAAGTIEKPLLDENEETGTKALQDPVIENINELLSSEEVAPEKKEKLETLQQDIMQKLEESKKNYSRDREAEAVLIAGANYHRLNKKY